MTPTNHPTTITIHLAPDEADGLGRTIQYIEHHLKLDPNSTLSHLLLGAAVAAMADIARLNERKATAAAGIRKLKAEEEVSTAELDAVFYEAKGGNLEAAIVVEDFKRFGRSMERKRPSLEDRLSESEVILTPDAARRICHAIIDGHLEGNVGKARQYLDYLNRTYPPN